VLNIPVAKVRLQGPRVMALVSEGKPTGSERKKRDAAPFSPAFGRSLLSSRRNCCRIVGGMTMIQPYDAPTIAVLRSALDDVCADQRFIRQRSTSTLEIAEHLLAQAAAGERDIDRLKASALAKLSEAA
jgi:hypothetical protein